MSGIAHRAELAYYLQHYRPRGAEQGHHAHDDVFLSTTLKTPIESTRSCDVRTIHS